jgi:Spy/CpxP family protein refolding chaperone
MTIEQRMDQLEKRNKRLTIVLTMMAVTICAVVTMAATNMRNVSNSKNGRWELKVVSENMAEGLLLDSQTGDMWFTTSSYKNPIKQKR